MELSKAPNSQNRRNPSIFWIIPKVPSLKKKFNTYSVALTEIGATEKE